MTLEKKKMEYKRGRREEDLMGKGYLSNLIFEKKKKRGVLNKTEE